MKDSYDVIVVGAGLGGLSAATIMARRGYDTLLLERHNVPGGYSTSFVRGRFEFEAALHELSDIGTDERPGVLKKLLDYLGVSKHVEFVQSPSLYRSVFPDLDITLPKGKEAYMTTMCDRFPHEADGIRRFMARVFAVAHEVDQLEKLQRAKLPRDLGKLVSLPFKMRSIPRYLFATWGDVLYRDVKDEQARAVLSQYWGYFGLGPSKCAFFYFALALASYIKLGASHVHGRSHALSNAFIKTFNELGGDVVMSCGVRKIQSDGDRVVGVVTDEGREISAKAVISNADPIVTCRDLLGVENTPPAYFEKLRHNEIANSSFNVYLGIAKPIEDFGIEDHEIFINKDYDFDSHSGDMETIRDAGFLALTVYNAILPDISPPGTCQAVLTTLMYGAPWRKVKPEDYVDTKNRLADSMIDSAEKLMPGLRAATEVVEVSTPVTNMRYVGSLDGSIYGFQNTAFNHTILRLSAQGALDNLYQVGAYVQMGGGFSPSMLSGQMAGDRLHMKLKKTRGRA